MTIPFEPSAGSDHSDLTLALALADTADSLTMDRFGAQDLRIDSKPDLTPVSDADLATERKLRELLADARPDDAVLGEEFGGDPVFDGRQWVIDPIDGTKNYVRGVPVWSRDGMICTGETDKDYVKLTFAKGDLTVIVSED